MVMKFIIMLLCLFSFTAKAENLSLIIQSPNGQPHFNAKLLGKYMTKYYPGNPTSATSLKKSMKKSFLLLVAYLFMTVFAAQAETLTVITTSINNQPYYSARLLGKYLSRYYPNSPEISFKVVPGANGITAANYLYNVAPKDGLTFGMLNRNTALASLLGDKNAQFEIDKFVWLGSSSDNRVNPAVVVSHHKYDGTELNMAEVGSTEGSTVNMISSISGWKLKRISGYKDIPEIRLSFLRKEIDVFYIPYSTLMANHPELKENIVLQYGNGLLRNPAIIHAPTLMELANDNALRYQLALRELTEILNRPFVMPPGVSNEKVVLLREAFFKALNDPELIIEADKLSIDISPIFWSQAESIVKQMKSIDKETLKSLN